jgi:hypothetical protein
MELSAPHQGMSLTHAYIVIPQIFFEKTINGLFE